MPRLLSFLSRRFWTGGCVLLAAGVVFQAPVKDHVPWLALFFYATPKPCLAALALALALWPGTRTRQRLEALAVVAVLCVWWCRDSWRSGPEAAREPRAGDVRVLFWNLARPEGVHEGMVELVDELRPHIAAFVEPGRGAGERLKDYEARLPGYEAAWMPRGILWLSRTPSRYRERGKLEGAGAFARFDVSGLGPVFTVVVADVYQHPFRSRKGQLDEVLAHSPGLPDALLAGDFNTPLESALLAPVRARFTNALEAAGRGFKETWPVGLPLLSLDQVWAGPAWGGVEGGKIWRVRHSDHAAVFVVLRRR